MALSSAASAFAVLTTFAEKSPNAPISALVWWIIPIVALVGGLSYAFWVSRLKSKFDNQTERSVDRFQKFQKSFEAKKNRDDRKLDGSK